MINIYVEIGKTADKDYVINTDNDFPIAYIGRGSYTGNVTVHSYHHYSVQETAHLIYIGRYSSLGDNIHIYCDLNHDYRSVYMGVIPEFADPSEDAPIRERVGQNTKGMKHKGMVLIGSDVWIGDDVTLISDVTIGNGAVIGAGSVVAKDIPPYTIWCGNPAVCIGSRFSDETIAGFQKICWWDWDIQRLKDAETDMKGDPNAFVSKYLPEVTDCPDSDNVYGSNTEHPVMAAFIDSETAFPTYGDIIEQFITGYTDQKAELVLYHYRDNENDAAVMGSISGLLEKLAGRVNIHAAGIDPNDDEAAIKNAGCLVLGRDLRNIKRLSLAQKYGIKCISGANRPIF